MPTGSQEVGHSAYLHSRGRAQCLLALKRQGTVPTCTQEVGHSAYLQVALYRQGQCLYALKRWEQCLLALKRYGQCLLALKRQGECPLSLNRQGQCLLALKRQGSVPISSQEVGAVHNSSQEVGVSAYQLSRGRGQCLLSLQRQGTLKKLKVKCCIVADTRRRRLPWRPASPASSRPASTRTRGTGSSRMSRIPSKRS